MENKVIRIAVIDDDADTVRTLSVLLEHEGYEVVPGYSAGEALAAAKRDLAAMVLDINLPDDTGYTVAENVVRMCGDNRPLLIALSGRWMGHTDKLLAKMAGFDYHLAKPCDPQVLLKLLGEATEKNLPAR